VGGPGPWERRWRRVSAVEAPPERRSRRSSPPTTRRIAATIKGDLAGLAAMMTDDLTYTHSSGVEETKAHSSSLKTGKYVYREITPRDRRVRVHGDAAIVSGPVAW